jgi:hypothetical protein
MVNILVLLVCLAGAIYYVTVDKEPQGAIVVLLGILYFLGLPHIVRRE